MKERINTLRELKQRYNKDESKFIESFIDNNAELLTDALEVTTYCKKNEYSDLVEFLDKYDYLEAYFGGLKIYDIIQQATDFYTYDEILHEIFENLMEDYIMHYSGGNRTDDRIYDMLSDIQTQMLYKES